MYNLTNQLLEQYDMDFGGIQKGRGVYVCSTQRGNVVIKQFTGSRTHVESMSEILDALQEEGIRADRILRTKEGGLLAKDVDETLYYARWQLPGRECETKERGDVLTAMRLLGQMHSALEKKEIACQIVPRDALQNELQKHNREIRKVRNYVHGKNKKNEFEMIFMRHYQIFLNQAEESEKSLREWKEQQKESDIRQMYGICHGDYNQHNILIDQKGGQLTNFEQTCYDMRVRDLAHFLRKLMEKHNWNVALSEELLAAYEKERRLSEAEWRQLSIRLSYPEKFWKVANHYFNSNKAWVSARDIEKLNRVIEQEEIRQEFLRNMFHFIR
ncbi:MAG: CotS family spore coat protein [Lachnospiraceae bacterium]|nr:CotS family spore coat protein [Lachnospiraceae bacterium]